MDPLLEYACKRVIEREGLLLGRDFEIVDAASMLIAYPLMFERMISRLSLFDK
ncbi:hypothetical protein QWU01_25335 [Kluyvera cryocrescens]|uniref:Uncharacterized protein n=1 Tax=Kluyvera cryocrescens TaxID=580 RepID=A0AAW9CDB0_KLUCR|nr:hypothetical protein [Kluyvera cryocrescens]MDW3780121.1 hypothetical protein [Kluyvera cryocrescens]